jgi:hypothetical protein
VAADACRPGEEVRRMVTDDNTEHENQWFKTHGFALNHPLVALEVGKPDLDHDTLNINISSVAGRVSLRTRLSPGPGLGTEVNAVRHVVWMAMITARFGDALATDIGAAHESDPGVNERFSVAYGLGGIGDGWVPYNFSDVAFKSLLLADQSVDLLNNGIGRSLGWGRDGLSGRDSALMALEEFRSNGLWMALPQSDGTWAIEQRKLTDQQYSSARDNILKLDENGFNPEEQQRRAVLPAWHTYSEHMRPY